LSLVLPPPPQLSLARRTLLSTRPNLHLHQRPTMQFTVLALFAAAASLVVATPVPEIDTINAYPVVVSTIEVANAGLQVRAKAKAPAPLRVGSDDAFQTNSCNGTSPVYIGIGHRITTVPSSSSCRASVLPMCVCCVDRGVRSLTYSSQLSTSTAIAASRL